MHAASSVVALAAARVADPVAARSQMGFSLAWHIILACFGVGFPGLVIFAEWRGLRTGDAAYRLLARRWAKVLGVLFAVGAVSGTILSVELGVLWSGLMTNYGQVIGLPFAIEGIAFFIEAIFLGIYLYGWDRLPPKVHLLSGLPIFAAGLASAFFVVCANAWMNTPTGFTVSHGRITHVDPWAAMFNPATGPETAHMILAALMVTGFGVASVYAVAMLRGRRDRYHRLGLLIPLTGAAILTPVQIVVGDWAARMVATYQPTKLAAMEGLASTTKGAPEALFGYFSGGRLHDALHIPDGLSLLARLNPHAAIQGLDAVPASDRPPLVTLVHLSFDLMVSIGFGLLALGAWLAWSWWRGREVPRTAWFLRAVGVSGIAAVAAMELGWITTEVGRQPWIVYRVLRVANAVNPEPGIQYGFYAVVAIYAVLTVITIAVLRRLATTGQPT
ncbi:MAG TPA: cytochrome ubiquinol oxidase subunit I [Streptosporangiaceae bacterium]|jgi:cytochrome d ubiquinol oxidase subunit I